MRRTNSIPDIDTVHRAVRYVAIIFPDQVSFLPSGLRSAAESTYRDPRHVAHVLVALAFFGNDDGLVQRALKETMGSKAKWRPRDSDATRARYGRSRCFKTADGCHHRFDKHVTIGSGCGNRACAQVYYRSAEDGRIEIGWVGHHLPTVSGNR